MSDAIQRVGVVGAGQMGSGIAEVSARAGVEVTVFEPAEALITAGRNRIVKSLERAVSAGKVTERERDRALGLLTFTTDLNDLSDRQLVIEALSRTRPSSPRSSPSSTGSSPIRTRCWRRIPPASRS
ncbi:3-hydroxybutyryl-CoA dehydrogenase [Mycobacterium tuberculosis]|nr:3-hydroxybutyryl-CoA dehydrogenase [Mycobacterium tuberculosis]